MLAASVPVSVYHQEGRTLGAPAIENGVMIDDHGKLLSVVDHSSNGLSFLDIISNRPD